MTFRTPSPPKEVRRSLDIYYPRGWQEEAFTLLKDVPLGLLNAPTGSGKSLICQALAIHRLKLGRKVIITVPYISIGEGFKFRKIFVPGHGDSVFSAHLQIGDDDVVDGIISFLKRSPKLDKERTVVCTHSSLRRAFKQAKELGILDQFKDVDVFIDEAHHSEFITSRNSDGEVKSEQNSLGAIVNHYIEHSPGHLTLITATFMRSDSNSVVSEESLNKFVPYVRHFDEHLESLQNLRNVNIRFVSGDPWDCYRSLMEENIPSEKYKTTTYIPRPGKLLREQSKKGKLGVVDKCQKIINGFGFKGRHLDLVDPDNGRDENFSEFLNQITSETKSLNAGTRQIKSPTPDSVFAMNMLGEGSDWPNLRRSILTAPRSSMNEMVQLIGRLLRDCPGKDSVEFIVIFPVSNGKLEAHKVKDYLKIILASMVIDWQFHRVRLYKKSPMAAKINAENQIALMDEAMNVALSTSENLSNKEAARKVKPLLKKRIQDQISSDEKRIVTQTEVEDAIGDFFRISATMYDPKDVDFNVNIDSISSKSICGLVQSFVVKLGWSGFRELRQALEQKELPSDPFVDDSIRHNLSIKGFYPNINSGRIMSDDHGRTWNYVNDWLFSQYGYGLHDRCVQLGMKRNEWREPPLKQEIKKYKNKYGVWPGPKSGALNCMSDKSSWFSADEWCHRMGYHGLDGFRQKFGLV